MARGISGKEGQVVAGGSTIAELTEWSGTLAKNVQTYNPQSGSGWQKTIVGNKSFNGQIGGKYDPNDPIDAQLDTDNLVALLLYFSDSSGKYVNVAAARLDNLAFTENLDTGEIVSWTCDFMSDGTVTFV